MNHITKAKVYNHGMITTSQVESEYLRIIAMEEDAYIMDVLNHVHWNNAPRWTENAALSSSGLANSDLQNAKTIPFLWV
ncbi:hypothetical protein BOTCAL_0768g00030 [Botryotinia calthae]|uniref:Uncharacterized protein n=1 Tax=Botryotinia calthae TaxID=38488 RepID=A0A4Y8CI09_9HELO|nr:hypothetical protein BOTCAL_0768g00030 [Botryotinia calthae]